jgi:predicted TIM-barrel fold metal-dependent hydrolase
MEIIDAHNHIWPEKVVSKAKDYLESFTKHKLITLPAADNLLKVMDEANISKSIISSIASYPHQVVPINNWLFSIKQKGLFLLLQYILF